MSILEGELAASIADALIEAAIPVGVTLVRTVPGESDPSTPWVPGEPVVCTYSALGLTDAYSALEIDGTLVQHLDVKALVIPSSILKATACPAECPASIEPMAGDAVSIGGRTYTVISVSTDPATALWVVQARV